jgi:hypothetical protein
MAFLSRPLEVRVMNAANELQGSSRNREVQKTQLHRAMLFRAISFSRTDQRSDRPLDPEAPLPRFHLINPETQVIVMAVPRK